MKKNIKLLLKKRFISLLCVVIFIFTLLAASLSTHTPVAYAQTILTSGTTWTVPNDWNSSSNYIEVVGGGGGGGTPGYGNMTQGAPGAGGGGGGGYSKAINVILTPGSTVTITVGAGGAGGTPSNTMSSGQSGGDTYICNSTTNCSSSSDTAVVVGAKGGGGGGGAAGGGGASSAGVGTYMLPGGGAAAGSAGTASNGGDGGGGGGGAGCGAATCASSSVGLAGNAGSGTLGGSGDGGFGGAGASATGGAGSNGTEWDATHGSGGGGGGGAGGSGKGKNGSAAGAAGSYGAGGGGGGGAGLQTSPNSIPIGGTGGNGTAGAIIINYLPAHSYTQTSFRWYANVDSASPTTSLANVNTNYTSTAASQQFRLRQLVQSSGTDTAGYQNFNLQFADLSTYGACSAIPSGNWQNVSAGRSASMGAGSGTNDFSYGNSSYQWNTPGNITAQDGSISYVSNLSSGISSTYLRADHFGFSIPTTATIDGIKVTIRKMSNVGSGTTDSSVKLAKAGTFGGTDKASAAGWSSSFSNFSYGSSTDLWGQTWGPSDINDPNFAVGISAQGSMTNSPEVDFISVTVSYSNIPPIAYYDNPTPTSGTTITSTANDPTDPGQTVTAQTYQETDNFSNTSSYGGTIDAEWDFSLYDNGAPPGTTYCFRIARSNGTPLDSYTYYPQLTTYSAAIGPTTDQVMRGGTWFNPSGSKQSKYWAQ